MVAERSKLLDDIEKNTLISTLQSLQDKLQDMLVERPDFFDNVGEDIHERLAHLISFVQTQASQITQLQK